MDVPRGSIFNPLLFNIFINDLFYFISEKEASNFAEYNTLCSCKPENNFLNFHLDLNNAPELSKVNLFEAFPGTFQSIALTTNKNNTFTKTVAMVKRFHLQTRLSCLE